MLPRLQSRLGQECVGLQGGGSVVSMAASSRPLVLVPAELRRLSGRLELEQLLRVELRASRLEAVSLLESSACRLEGRGRRAGAAGPRELQPAALAESGLSSKPLWLALLRARATVFWPSSRSERERKREAN